MARERKMLGWWVAWVVSVAFVAFPTGGVEAQESGESGTSSGAASTTGTSMPFGGAITSDDYVIEVDDILTIDGYQHVEFNPMRPYAVAKDGTIKLVYIGRVPAAGLTKRQLEEDLEKRYAKFFKNLVLNVTVRSKTYTIAGEVRNPGIHPLQIKTTITRAIARAGDFTDFAKQSKVIILRNSPGGQIVRHEVDCEAILRGKAEDFVIEPNDVVYVPRKGLF